jgi:hypothetical protein
MGRRLRVLALLDAPILRDVQDMTPLLVNEYQSKQQKDIILAAIAQHIRNKWSEMEPSVYEPSLLPGQVVFPAEEVRADVAVNQVSTTLDSLGTFPLSESVEPSLAHLLHTLVFSYGGQKSRSRVIVNVIKLIRAVWTVLAMHFTAEKARRPIGKQPDTIDTLAPFENLIFTLSPPDASCYPCGTWEDTMDAAQLIELEYVAKLFEPAFWAEDEWAQVCFFRECLKNGWLHDQFGKYVIVVDGAVSEGCATAHEAFLAAAAVGRSGAWIMHVGAQAAQPADIVRV